MYLKIIRQPASYQYDMRKNIIFFTLQGVLWSWKSNKCFVLCASLTAVVEVSRLVLKSSHLLTLCQDVWCWWWTTPGAVLFGQAEQGYVWPFAHVVERDCPWNCSRLVNYHTSWCGSVLNLESNLPGSTREKDHPFPKAWELLAVSLSLTVHSKSALYLDMPTCIHSKSTFFLDKCSCKMHVLQSFSHAQKIQLFTEDASKAVTFAPPILALWCRKPTDGLPILQDWMVTAHDICHVGFEGWRETIEAKCPDNSILGKPIEYGCLVPTKGIGRATVLLFGILYTFHELKDNMNQEEVDDFKRQQGGMSEGFKGTNQSKVYFLKGNHTWNMGHHSGESWWLQDTAVPATLSYRYFTGSCCVMFFCGIWLCSPGFANWHSFKLYSNLQ